MMIPSQYYSFSGIVTLFFIFTSSLVLHTLASPTLYHCRNEHRDALDEFKHEFPVSESIPSDNDDSLLSSWLKSWNKSIDCCSWMGVVCDAKSGEVISLDLMYVSLSSSLKPNSALFKLHSLQNLNLFFCNLYGEIPSSIGNLSRLRSLDLLDNNLVGQVPASIGNLTQLKYIDLSQNKFSGNIPVSFANLTKLSKIMLNNNYFESTLPHNMSRFHNLEYFDVGGNSFVDPFPTSLFTIHSLKWVNMTGNQFKGPIELGNISSLSRLRVLYLSHNKFDGPIPDSISKLVNLKVLHLSYNNFIGTIPSSISMLVKLSHLDISNNKLEGEIPGYLWGLTLVMLSHNSFSSFGRSSKVFNETQIQILGMNSNSFRGPFPRWICKLTSLRFLDLSNNDFIGSIPPCIRNFTSPLEEMVLYNNNFSGIIPDIFANATKLKALDVSHNQLKGKLPKSLINCKAMQFLNVESNRIKDKFPTWLGSLPSLHVLILKSNELYGPLYHPNVSIGFQSLRVVDISQNGLTGTLPPFYFSSWRAMTTLMEEVFKVDPYMDEDLSFDTLYSYSMEMVHKGVDTKFDRIRDDFRTVDFSGNIFCGNIPESIGLLKELRLLNLSCNRFTSNIPQSLANLTNLEALDLSRNQLSGQIPQDLDNLSFLSTMSFSHNYLEGPIPRGTQFQRQNCSSFMDNPNLYGFEEMCGETHISNPTRPVSEDFLEEKEQVINWIAAAIAYGPSVFCGLVMGQVFASHKHKLFMNKLGRYKPRAVIISTH